MNPKEIDDMMRHLPSQRHRYPSKLDETLACLGFFAFLAIIALL